MEILKNIHRIDKIFYNNVYLITEDIVVLIDTGFRLNAKRIITYIKNKTNKLDFIILTHYHPDHTGGVNIIANYFGSIPFIHFLDVYHFRKVYPKASKIYKFLDYISLKYQSSIGDIQTLKEGYEFPVLGGLKVIHTPGHTPGSISLYSKERKILFTGDSLQVKGGRIRKPNPTFYCNPLLAEKSIKRLLSLQFKHLLPSDGEFIININKPLILGKEE